MILDSLNTSLLYDDRNGVMMPLSPGVETIKSSNQNLGIRSVNFNSINEIYTISGKRISQSIKTTNARPFGIYIERASDGILVRRLGNRIN
jgi:hypothetical protein